MDDQVKYEYLFSSRVKDQYKVAAILDVRLKKRGVADSTDFCGQEVNHFMCSHRIYVFIGIKWWCILLGWRVCIGYAKTGFFARIPVPVNKNWNCDLEIPVS